MKSRLNQLRSAFLNRIKKPEELPAVIEGQQPQKMNQQIYENGTLVFLTHTIRSWNIENWVRKIATRSEQPVDWHFAGGRACVLALGDLDKVREALHFYKAAHDQLYLEAIKELHAAYEDGQYETDEEILRNAPTLNASYL